MGNIYVPITLLSDMQTRIEELKSKYNDCSLSGALQCDKTETIEANYASLKTQLNVLSSIVGKIKNNIWNVTNTTKKTDEQE